MCHKSVLMREWNNERESVFSQEMSFQSGQEWVFNHMSENDPKRLMDYDSLRDGVEIVE